MNDSGRQAGTTLVAGEGAGDGQQVGQARAGADDAAPLSFDIDEQPVLASGTQRLTERTDLPVTGLPRPEPRRMPFWARLRLIWHRQVLRDAG